MLFQSVNLQIKCYNANKIVAMQNCKTIAFKNIKNTYIIGNINKHLLKILIIMNHTNTEC